MQLLIVRVTVGDKTVDISNCYRRQGKHYIKLPKVPSLTEKQYIEEYTKIHMEHINVGRRLLIGDFNIETSVYGMPHYIRDMYNKLKVLPTINEGTTQKRTRCIDNQFCSVEIMKFIKSYVIHNPWKSPSSPHGIIDNKFYDPPPDDYSSAFTSTAQLQSNSVLYTIPESSSAEESSASPFTNNFHESNSDARTYKDHSNNYELLHDSMTSFTQLECGSMMMMVMSRQVSPRFIQSPIVESRIQLHPSIVAPSIKPSTHRKDLKKDFTNGIQSKPVTKTNNEQKRLGNVMSLPPLKVSHLTNQQDEILQVKNFMLKLQFPVLIRDEDINVDLAGQTIIRDDVHIEP